MKNLIIITVITIMASCRCPETITSTHESHDTTVVYKTDTVFSFKSDTVFLPGEIIKDTFNFSTICDSLFKGIAVHKKSSVRHGTVKIDIDSSGHGTVECETDSLQHIIDSLSTTITTVIDSTIRHDKEVNSIAQVPVRDWWYKFYKYFTLAASAIGVVLLVGIYLGKR